MFLFFHYIKIANVFNSIASVEAIGMMLYKKTSYCKFVKDLILQQMCEKHTYVFE